MSTKQPTPDSWAVNPINPTFVNGPPGFNHDSDGDWAICQTFGPDAEANAVLIAASRDMLAECEKALEFVLDRLRTEAELVDACRSLDAELLDEYDSEAVNAALHRIRAIVGRCVKMPQEGGTNE